MKIAIQHTPFDISEEVEKLRSINGDEVGAISSFMGFVRKTTHGKHHLTSMTLEHYPEMSRRALNQIGIFAKKQWTLKDLCIIHRVGKLVPQDPIVLVLCTSAHRAQSLESCQYIIDHLKIHAPFWKKEFYSDGSSQWVQQRKQDVEQTKAWSHSP